MPNDFQGQLKQGAHNLLINCARCQAGQSVLIIYETETDGYYDSDLPAELVKISSDLGLNAELYGVPLTKDAVGPDEALTKKIEQSDCAIYLARLGDQIRFHSPTSTTTQVVSYALDREMLGSSFGGTDYKAFTKLKALIDTAVASAKNILVTCPAGTKYHGTAKKFNPINGDTTLKRFPISVFTPVPSIGFSGRIAQVGFITGTGSNFYSPWTCEIKETLFIEIEGSRIVGFDGSTADVAAAKAHYEFVSEKYDIDTYFVHSWHAGIHPGLAYKQEAGQYFERWSGGAFGNPRLLHLHTCGDYPPGEISLNVLDPTVRIDDVAIWENGQLYPERLTGGTELFAQYPEMREVFACPNRQVGQAPSDRLSYSCS